MKTATFKYLLVIFCWFMLAKNAVAQLPSPQLPATGLWNGFNNHFNVVECSNFNTQAVTLRISMRDFLGNQLGQVNIPVAGLGTFHSILNSFDIVDTHGTYRLSLLPADNALAKQIYCHTMIYRLAAPGSAKQVEYAFSLPVVGSNAGITAGLFNSFNPEFGTIPVYNWLTIVNDDDQNFSANILLYDQTGNAIGSTQLSALPPGERRDLPLGHEQGQVVGLYRIIPDDLTQNYAATLVRYLANSQGSFNFAFPVLATKPECPSQAAMISPLGPNTRWAEIGNASNSSKNVTLNIYDYLGNLKETRILNLTPFAQIHTYLNPYLEENERGYFKVACGNASDEIIAQSMTYGHLTSNANSVSWAYATQASKQVVNKGQRLVTPYNTFLSALNTVELNVPSTSAQVRTDTFLINQTASNYTFYPLSINAGHSFFLSLHDLIEADTVGGSMINTSAAGSNFIAEQLRIYPHSQSSFGYVARIPSLTFDESVVAVELEEIITGLSNPTAITNAGDNTDRLFIAERAGRIKIYNGTIVLPAEFLNISAEVSTNGERGLLSLAFHPNYAANRKFYVHFTNLAGASVIREYQASIGDANIADISTARNVLTVTKSISFHNGGQIAFGPDGYLYIGLGDDQIGGDPNNHAQRLDILSGKILRINIDGAAPYAIPDTNPFISTPDALAEIFAYGFRNPWAFSFDMTSERLFAVDVGENAREEVNIVTAGGNYGWNVFEGSSCFFLSTDRCPTTDSIFPINEYSHQEGVAIIGSHIYRGTDIPELAGKLIIADYLSSRVWMLEETATGLWLRKELIGPASLFLSSIGRDEDNELYFTSLTGKVFKLSKVN